MGGKIEGYLDCASPYSYFAMKYLRERRDLLKQYGVEIEFYPFFLGGLHGLTGNKPPTALPAKAKFSPFDTAHAITHFNTPSISAPPFFPMNSLLPQRCMTAIRPRHPTTKYEEAFTSCWLYCFHHHRDLSNPTVMRQLLLEHFDEAETDEILRLVGTKEVKDQLMARTKEAFERYAFGAPWFWLTNEEGESEPMFGSDRFSYMFKFLGVQVTELTIVDKSKSLDLSAKL